MIKYKVGQILNRVKETLIIEDEQVYKRLTIRMYHKGVYLRDIEKGVNIGTKNQFIARSGQFIMSRIDARNGAFGIIPESIGHGAITNDFLSFTVNEEFVSIEFFKLYSQTDNFMQLCIEGSKGTTNRKRLKEEVFLEFEVYLPEMEKQFQIVDQIRKLQELSGRLNSELYFQKVSIQNLHQCLLMEAVQGKLVPQDHNDEPARVMLEKIKTKKEQLVKDKTIKMEKPLPEITEAEIPYVLPIGWEWVRLGELCKVIDYGTSTKASVENVGIPVLRMNNIVKGDIDFTNLKYVKKDIDDLPKLFLEDEDLIFNRTNSYELVGKTGLFTEQKERYTFASYLIRLTLIICDPVYINYYMNSIVYRKTQIEPRITQQNGQANFNGTKLKETLVPIPPINEQKNIVNKIDYLITLCNRLEKTVEQSKQKSDMLMQAVLQEAFQSI